MSIFEPLLESFDGFSTVLSLDDIWRKSSSVAVEEEFLALGEAIELVLHEQVPPLFTGHCIFKIPARWKICSPREMKKFGGCEWGKQSKICVRIHHRLVRYSATAG